MSLLDVILQQNLILLSMGLALLPMLVAIGVLLFTRFKKWRTHRQSRTEYVRAAAVNSEILSQHVVEAGINEQGAATAQRGKQSGVNGTDQPPQVAKAPAASSLSTTKTEQGSVTNTPETTQPEGMQNLLQDIFTDEDEDGKYEALLAGLSTVEISDLQELTQHIVQQLGVPVASRA